MSDKFDKDDSAFVDFQQADNWTANQIGPNFKNVADNKSSRQSNRTFNEIVELVSQASPHSLSAPEALEAARHVIQVCQLIVKIKRSQR